MASTKEAELGTGPNSAEQKVYDQSAREYSRNGTRVTCVVPLHDRNGDVAAVVSITSKRFFGESKSTTIFRGDKNAKRLELQFTDAAELLE